MKVLIDTGNGLQDYSQFIVDGSLTTEDSINVPSLLNFILSANQDNAFIVPKRSSYVKVISDIYAALPATATTSVPLNIQGVGADAGASYSPAQGFPGNTQLAVDPSGNIYASLTMNSVYFGLLAKVSPSGQILATQGDSGTCLIGVSRNPLVCWNCQAKYPPCFGYGGDVAYTSYGGGYVGVVNATPSGFGNNVNVCRASDLSILNGAGGWFPYGSVGSLNTPSLAADSAGNFYCLNTNGTTTSVEVCQLSGGSSPTCPQCFGPGETQVYQYNTSNNYDVTASLGTAGDPCCGVNPADGTVIMALAGSTQIIKWSPTLHSVVGTLSTTGMLIDRVAFKHIGADGIMVVRGTDSFIVINTTTMTVVGTLSNVHTLLTKNGNAILSGQGGTTAYDPTTNTVIFYDGSVSGSTTKLFAVNIGSANPNFSGPTSPSVADVTGNAAVWQDTVLSTAGATYAINGGNAQIVSTQNVTGQKILATGFITNEIEREYLGLNPHLSNFGNQQLAYKVSVTSDEWLLNTRTVPYLPAFVGQTQGQILAQLANTLAPGFFDVTSFVASGDIVPYFQYDPTKTWSDIAKEFGDSSRYRYKVIDKKIYYQPFGDQPLGIAYDETQPNRKFFPLEMETRIVTVPPVNDAIVIGATEPQANWENYFVGDGLTSNFRLLHQVFDGATALLLQDDWTQGSLQTNTWQIGQDLGHFLYATSLNVITTTGGTPLNTEFLLAKQGLELGGGLNLTHGEFIFTDYCQGIVGGIYTSTALTQANCIAAFNLSTQWAQGSNPGALTASGASGIVIQPMYNGSVIGPQVVTQVNHHYVLQTFIGAEPWNRYNRVYRNLTGSAAYGGNALSAEGTITFSITDYDEGLYATTVPQPFLYQQIVPQVTKFSVTGAVLPEFASYALINNEDLNLVVNYTTVAQPPEGSLYVRSLTGATGTQLPILPQNLGPEFHYVMGFGLQGQTATVSAQADTQNLAFYSDTIPAVGARIRYQSWASGEAASRVINPVSVAQEAVVSGDSGVRSAIFTNLSPPPRTSDECESAAAAAILDREFPQFQGAYTVQTLPTKFETLFNPGLYDYPRTGRFLYINSPMRGVSGQLFPATTIRMSVLELREEALQIAVDYGPDLYLEKLLVKFNDRLSNVLTPQETANPPNPIYLSQVGNAFLPSMDTAKVINITNDPVTGNTVTIDLGVIPVTACEIRRVDNGFGTNDANRVAYVVGQRFITLQRTSRDQVWYLRQINGGAKSRFSKALRIVYPLVPAPPRIVSSNANTVVFDYASDVRDVYGLEIRALPTSGVTFLEFPAFPEDQLTQVNRQQLLAPTDAAAAGQAVVNNSNVAAYYNPASNAATFPFPGHFQVGDIVYVTCPGDNSFANMHIISNEFTASGSVGPQPVANWKITFSDLQAYFFNALSGTKGSFYHPHPLGSVYSTVVATGAPSSLLFNWPIQNNRVYPMTNEILDEHGNHLGKKVLWNGMNQNWDMAITGKFYVPAGGPSTGTNSFVFVHDDGFLIGMDGGVTVDSNAPNVDLSVMNTTSVLGLPTIAGYNGSGDRTHAFGIHFPAAGVYNFEIDYDNWESAEHLFVTANGYDILPVQLSAPVSGAPWGIGWFDYQQPFPKQVGQDIAYGVNSVVGTVQMYQRGPHAVLDQISVAAGYTGVCTATTVGPHGFNTGDPIMMGCSWQTFPVTGYGNIPNTGAVFCGQQVVTGTPNGNTFTFVCPQLVVNPNPIPGSWEDNLANLGVSPQKLNGVVAKMPTPFTLNSANGMILQRPVFAPSDLVVDFTQADLATTLGILQKLSPNGRVQGLNAYFFNLTWDYSLPQPIASVTAPVLTGVFINDQTQTVAWSVATGKPTGYRVLVQDPVSYQVYNVYTIDHPHNPTGLLSIQLTPIDFANNRLISVTPFDVIGDGVPGTIYHAGGSAGTGGTSQGSIYTDIVDVRSFGAIGDGIADDTKAVQDALHEAAISAASAHPNPGATIVLIPSSLNCVVTPQFLDGSVNSASGFGPTAVALTIGTGVTLRIDGNLTLGAPSFGFGSNPWVVLENDSAYATINPGDANVTIEGQGNIVCNGSTLNHQVAAVKLVGVSGSRIEGMQFLGHNLYGIAIGPAQDCWIENCLIQENFPSIKKIPGTVLTDVLISNNVMEGAPLDFLDPSNPVFNDGLSTVLEQHLDPHPQHGDQTFRSFVSQIPTVEGAVFGSGGFVFPLASPNCFYAVSATGSFSGAVLVQNGTSSSIVVNPFTITWPDKSLSYNGTASLSPTVDHGVSTYHVFVDDPYREANPVELKYGTTVRIPDLTNSAGRYYLGTVYETTVGGVTGTVGGMIPPGSITTGVPTTTAGGTSGLVVGTQGYDIGCTVNGLVPPSGYLVVVPMVRAMNYQSNFVPSRAWAQSTAVNTTVLHIYKSTGGSGTLTSIGSLTYGSGQRVGAFSGTATAFNEGDVLLVLGPNTLDLQLQNIGFVLSGFTTTTAFPFAQQLGDQLVMTDGTPVVTPGATISINIS